MRVLHVLDVSAPTIVGYATRSRAIVNVQRSLGLEPVVLTSPRHKNDGRANLEELDGIPHYRTLKPSVRNPVVEMYWLRQRILEVARQERVDLIHAHSPILTGIPAWMAARQLGLPSIYEIRALWEDGAVDKGACTVRSLRYRLSRGAETFLARSVDAVVCICEGLRRELNARGLSANRLHVVQNGVNTSRFILRPPDPAIQAQLGLTGQTVIGFVGSLFGYEGVVDLVEALAQLIKQGRKDLVGLIVGSGEALSSCRQIAESHGLSNQIQHLGQVAAEDVEKLYSVMDVLVYPRRRSRVTELVTPLKPLEAMAMAKAVIGSNVGGLQELIVDGVSGLFYRAGDISDLASKITQLADDPHLCRVLGHQARAAVSAHRDWQSIIPRYVPIYEAVCARRKRTFGQNLLRRAA